MSARRLRVWLRVCIAAVGCAALCGLAYLWYWTGAQPSSEDAAPGTARIAGEPVGESAVPNLPHTAGRTPERSGTSLWRVVDERTAGGPIPNFPSDWSRAGRALVDVSATVRMAPNWRTGSGFRIDVPQLGKRYDATIERIDQGIDGRSRAVRGMAVDGTGQGRRFVVTVGPMHVLAYLDTAAGPYELVGNNRLGWLLPTSSMMAGWDFSEPDCLLPDREGVPDGP